MRTRALPMIAAGVVVLTAGSAEAQDWKPIPAGYEDSQDHVRCDRMLALDERLAAATPPWFHSGADRPVYRFLRAQ
jgi:hypothetical protein